MLTASGSPQRAVRTGSKAGVSAIETLLATPLLAQSLKAGQQLRGLLQVARDAAARCLRDLTGADGGDHLVQPFLGHSVVVDVVHGQDRSLVARGQALLFFDGEQAVRGGLLRAFAQRLAGVFEQAPPASQRAGGV